MKTGTSSLMDSHLVDFSNKNANNIKSDTSQKIYGEHQIQMLEISDEEIEEASRQINYGGGSEGWIKDAFKKGAKWYREQLKRGNNE